MFSGRTCGGVVLVAFAVGALQTAAQGATGVSTIGTSVAPTIITEDDDDEDCLPGLERIARRVVPDFDALWAQCEPVFSGIGDIVQQINQTARPAVCSSPCMRPMLAVFQTAGVELKTECPTQALQYGSIALVINSLICTENAAGQACGNIFTNIERHSQLCSIGCCGKSLLNLVNNSDFRTVIGIGAQQSSELANGMAALRYFLSTCNGTSDACPAPNFAASPFQYDRPTPTVITQTFPGADRLTDAQIQQIAASIRSSFGSDLGNGTVVDVTVTQADDGSISVTTTLGESVTPSEGATLKDNTNIKNMEIEYTAADGTAVTATSTGTNVKTPSGGSGDAASTVGASIVSMMVATVAMLFM